MPWLPAVRAIHLAASALVAGGLAFEVLLLRRAAQAVRAPELAAQVRRWSRGLAAFGIAAGLLSWLGWLAEVAIAMTGLPPAQALAPSTLAIVLGDTTFGHVWVFRTLLLCVVLPAFLLRRPAPGRPFGAADAAALLAGALLLGSLAWTGHAVASTPAHLWVDAAHLCAAALWVGMLPPLLLALQRACATRAPDALQFAGEAARRFAVPGTIAVAVLVVTGALNTWWLVGSPQALVEDGYGRLLLAKLALFAAMIGLAAINRFALAPATGETDARGLRASLHLRRSVAAEAVLAAAVLAIVGALGVMAPPAHRAPMPSPEPGHEHGLAPGVNRFAFVLQ